MLYRPTTTTSQQASGNLKRISMLYLEVTRFLDKIEGTFRLLR